MAWWDAQPPRWLTEYLPPTQMQKSQLHLQEQQFQLQQEHYALQRAAYAQRLEALREHSRLELAKQAAEDRIRLRTEEGYAKLAHHMATVGDYPGGLGNTEFRKGFWSIAGDYPSMDRDARFHYFMDEFTGHDKMEARKEAQTQAEDFKERMAGIAQEGRETLQQMRGRQALEREQARQSGRVDLEGLRSKHRFEQIVFAARQRAGNRFLTDRMQLAAFHAKLDAALRGLEMLDAPQEKRLEAVNQVLRMFNLGEAGLPVEEPGTEDFLPTDSPPTGLPAGPTAPTPAAPAAPPTLNQRFEQWLKKQ